MQGTALWPVILLGLRRLWSTLFLSPICHLLLWAVEDRSGGGGVGGSGRVALGEEGYGTGQERPFVIAQCTTLFQNPPRGQNFEEASFP